MVATYFLIINLLLGFKLWNDKRLHDDPNKRVNHPLSASIDSFIYTCLGWLWFGWDVGFFVLFALSYRWIMFDLLFNKINHWHWAFCGDTSKIDVIVDRLDGAKDNRCILSFVFKCIILITSILLLWWNRFM